MSKVNLEPGWLAKDVVQAARRAHELDEQKSQARPGLQNRSDDNPIARSDTAKNDRS